MAKKSERQRAVAHADKWFSKYIRERDRASVLSGEKEGLNCGHVFSRKNYSTRWDEFNAFAQTAGENYEHEFDPYPYFKWFEMTFGAARLETLHRKHRTPRKFTTAEIRSIGDYYRDKFQALTRGTPAPGEPPVENLSSWPNGFDVGDYSLDWEDEYDAV